MHSKADLEAGLISTGLKWSPVKIYEGSLDEEGVSSTWRLDVEYLERDKRQNIPEAGVPVAIVVTIDDPLGAAPVYSEMRAALSAGGLRLNDIRTALQARTRT